jgi:hypothetical protein
MNGDSRLVVSQGPQPGQTFMLDQDLLTLGRDPASHVVINDPQVSRQHARITRQGGMMILEDLGSTNGTFVNGMRLTGPHTLADGDVIGLGDAVTLTYYGLGLAATEALARPPGTTPPPPPAYTPPPSAPRPAPPPAYAAPPPPPPAYAGAPPLEEEKSKTGLYIACGCLALLALACAGLFIFAWFAPTSFWQALIDLGIPVPTWPF